MQPARTAARSAETVWGLRRETLIGAWPGGLLPSHMPGLSAWAHCRPPASTVEAAYRNGTVTKLPRPTRAPLKPVRRLHREQVAQRPLVGVLVLEAVLEL
jgi:hypothetical protein